MRSFQVLAIVLLAGAAWIWLANDRGREVETPESTPAAAATPGTAAVSTMPRANGSDRQEVRPAAVRSTAEAAAEPAPARLVLRARFLDERGSPCAAEQIQVMLVSGRPSDAPPPRRASSSDVQSVATDANGDLRATLAGPVGRVLLRVASHGIERAMRRIERTVALEAGDNLLDLGVVEMRTRLPVRVRVVDETGLPFLGAHIVLRTSDPHQAVSMRAAAETNIAQGHAVPGRYTVHAGDGGAVLAPRTLDVPHEADAMVEIVLCRETTIAGTVRDVAGQPVSAVTVFVEDLDDPSAHVRIPTDANGAFVLRGGSRPVEQKGNLWVFSDGRYALADGTGTPPRLPVTWGTTHLVVRVVASPSCTARVRVVRASDRQPLTAYRLWVDPPAEVRARYPDAFAGWVPGDPEHPDGVVTLPHVVPDLQTLLVVPEDRALALTAHALHAHAGENVVEIAVPTAPETVVRCVGTNGEPVDAKLELLTDEGAVPSSMSPTDIRATPPGAWKRPPTRWLHDSTTTQAGRGVLRGGPLGEAALVRAPEFGVTVPVVLAAQAEVTLVTHGRGELVVRFTDRAFTSIASLLLAIPHDAGARAAATIESERVTLTLAHGTYTLHLATDPWTTRTPSLARVDMTAPRVEVTLDGTALRPGLLRWRAEGEVRFLHPGGSTAATRHLRTTAEGYTETALLPGEYDAIGTRGVARVRIDAGAMQEVELDLVPSPFVLVLRRGGAPVVGRRVEWVVEGAGRGTSPTLGSTDAAGRLPVVTGAPPRGMRLAVDGIAEVLGPFDWPDRPELVVEIPR